MKKDDTISQQEAAESLLKMDAKELELYLYSLRKMAANNVESNRVFMTNLYNLRAFLYKAEEEMIQNPQLQFAVIVLDLANFKAVNAFCGREEGDKLLKHIADALREQMKEHVVLSHFRADTFGMLMPYETKEDLVSVVEQIGRRIDEFETKCKLLPAFGICVSEQGARSVSNMKDYATLALNTIKGKFYARYAFFDKKMNENLLWAKQVENDIVEALATGQLKIYVQPKVNMRTGEIVGGEALVRWIHPKRGVITPIEFIPVLEKNGFIISVDAYVWEEVFRFVGERLRKKKKIVPISVNISRLHAYDGSFISRMQALTDTYGVPPAYVPLELTESGFLREEKDMYAGMQALKELGFPVSMDDFGTGYSTMTMLKDEPVDEIKIDKGFIDGVGNAKSEVIVRHTVNMLKELQLDMIAEGVERRDQQDFLLECGCEKAQGFFYYKPMPMEEFARLIDSAGQT